MICEGCSNTISSCDIEGKADHLDVVYGSSADFYVDGRSKFHNEGARAWR